MRLFLAVALLGSATFAQFAIVDAKSQVKGPTSAPDNAKPFSDSTFLPPMPRGKSTILGGEIRTIDPVRDELTLKIFGQRTLTILFDERTRVYRDGKGIRLGDLHVTDHASVQTVLNGTDVYALSIHILSQSPEGEYQGQVENFNPNTRELTVNSVMSREPITLVVPARATIVRVGQTTFSFVQPGALDLVRGTIVAITFVPGTNGLGVARQIAVLATPGSVFAFNGIVSTLDMHSGILVIDDPQEEKGRQISFDSVRLPISRNLHPGDHVTVKAEFDGTRYIAMGITLN